MKTATKSKKTKVRNPRRALKAKLPSFEATGKPGDVARAMFAKWDHEHVDPKPVSWEKFKAVMEENRLREAPLFSK